MNIKIPALLFVLVISQPVRSQFQTNVIVQTNIYHDVCIEPLSYGSPPTTDYIVAGNLFDPAMQSERAFIKKVDQNGTVIWNNTYQEVSSPHLRILDIVNTLDLIFATGYVDIAGKRKVFVARFNAINGSFLQANYYDVVHPNFNSTGLHISFTDSDADGDSVADPGFMIAGYFSDCYNVDINCNFNNIGFVMRTDFNLNVLWAVETDAPNTVNTLDYDFVNGVTETSDGFFLTGSATWQDITNNNAQQVVLAHKIDFQGNFLWDESYVFGNSSDISVDAHYDTATDKIYMLANYSFTHYFGVTVFDNSNGAFDNIRSWHAVDWNDLNKYGFVLMPSINNSNDLMIAGYDRDESWNIGADPYYGETNVFIYEFNKDTGNPVGTNYQYLVPNIEPGLEDFNFWDYQMPLMYYPDMAFSKIGNGGIADYFLAGYRQIDPTVPDVSLELFKVDSGKRNTCDSKVINPGVQPVTRVNTPVTSAHISIAPNATNFTVVAMPYSEDFCVRLIAVHDNILENVKMYPNPAKETIHFSGSEIFDVRIADASGKTVIQESIGSQRQVNISILATGIYFVEIQNGQNKHIFKLIKE